MKLLMYLFLVVILVVVTSMTKAQPTQKPCLPSRIQFNGMDTKGRHSYNALDFDKRMFGMQRGDFRMVKDFSNREEAKRYDITSERCDVYNIDKNMDLPKCVPGTATQVSSKHGDAWKFRNIDGATLLYSVDDPSSIYEKISPDGKTSDNFFNSSAAITDTDIFNIPDRCHSRLSDL